MKLSIKEYMETRKVSRRTIYNRIESGQLETIKEKNKTYIIKENLKKIVKKDKSNDANIEELKEHFLLIKESYELIKNFNYKFISDRLANIEKSLINFSIDAEKSNSNINNKMEKLSEKVIDTLVNIENKNNHFLENLLIINEQNNKFFHDSVVNLSNSIENLSKKFQLIEEKLDKSNSLENLDKLEEMDNKIDEILKYVDSKKSFGIFKK